MARYDLPRLRKTHNMTQSELARLLKISQGFLSSVEKGKNPFPDDRIDDLQSIFPEIDLSEYEITYTVPQTLIGSDNSQSDVTVNDPATLNAMLQIIRETNKYEQQITEANSNRMFEMQDRILTLTDELEKTRKDKYELKEEILRLRGLLRENGIDYEEKIENQ